MIINLSFSYNTIYQIAHLALKPQKMLKKHSSEINRNISSFYNTQSFSLHQHQTILFNLKNLWLRKSFFFPQKGLDESYASRSHIAGADIPLVQILHSSERWLLVQTPKFSRKFFKKLNQAKFGNPYEQLIRIFKGFCALTRIYGYFRPTSSMITLQKKVARVWINQDIFSNQPQMPLRSGLQGEKEFVVAFLALVQSQMYEWERAINVCTVEETIKLLQWRNRINRGSYTAVNASKQATHVVSQPGNSINSSKLIIKSPWHRGSESMHKIGCKSQADFIQQGISSSITIQMEQKKDFPRKINKLLSDSNQQMKSSIYKEVKLPQPMHGVRTTKKKFNLASTSSTLQKMTEKLGITIGRKITKIDELQKETQPKQQLAQSVQPKQKQHQKRDLHRSEPISIANELEGLFEGDKPHELKLGIEGNKEQLEKIAQEMEQILIW